MCFRDWEHSECSWEPAFVWTLDYSPDLDMGIYLSQHNLELGKLGQWNSLANCQSHRPHSRQVSVSDLNML